MQVELPAELESYLRDAVARGDFASREELLADAVRLHRDYVDKLRALRADLQVAVDALDRGEGYDIRTEEEHHAFFREIDREGREMLGKNAAP